MNAEPVTRTKNNKEDLQVLFLQFLNSLDETDTINAGITIQTAMNDILRSKINAGLSVDAIEGYENTFRGIAKVIDVEGDVSSITQHTIEEYLEYLLSRRHLGKKLKKASINRRLREFRSWLNACRKRGYFNRSIEINEFRLDQSPVYIAEEKMNNILAKMKAEYRAFILLFLSLGCRLRELFQGTLETDNFIVLSAAHSKSRKRREFELSDAEVEIYKRLMASGLSPERLSRLFKKACVEAGYPEHHFHHIRHTMAVMNIYKIGIYELSRKLGHSSVKVTESSYLRFSERRIKKDFPSLFADS